MIHQLGSIFVEGNYANEDPVIWLSSGKGTFDCKSAMCLIERHVEGLNESKAWKRVWHVPEPQRVRLFLWLTRHDRLLTNVAKCKKGILPNPGCEICGEQKETTLHALRDCSWTARLW